MRTCRLISALLLGLLLALATTAFGNTPPTTVNDTFHSPALPGPFTFDVLANDSDPDGDPLTITSVARGISGQTTIVDNKIRYTPGAKFGGTEQGIRYTISDGHGGTATGILTLTNKGPVAVADTYTAAPGETVTLPVLDNDTDPDGDPLTLKSASSKSARITIVGNALQYTQNVESGDTVTYSITDGRGGSSSATVRVTVTGAPVVLRPPDVGAFGAMLAAHLGAVSPVDQYYVEYGSNGTYELQTQTQTAATPADVSVPLTDLLPGTDYHYRFVLLLPTGTVRSSEGAFTTDAMVPGRPAYFVSRQSDHRIVAFDPRGYSKTIVEGIGGGPIVYGPDGNLYLSDETGGKIWQVLTDGTLSVFADGFIAPAGFGFAPDGALIVADNDSPRSGRILRVNSDGSHAEITSKLPLLAELAVSRAGRIYATTAVERSSIYRIAPDGSTQPLASLYGSRGSIARYLDGFIFNTNSPSGAATISADDHIQQLAWSYYDERYVAVSSSGVSARYLTVPVSSGNPPLQHEAEPRVPECDLLPVQTFSSTNVLLRARLFTAGERVSTRFTYTDAANQIVATPWVDYDPSLAAIEVQAAGRNLRPGNFVVCRFEVRTATFQKTISGTVGRMAKTPTTAKADVLHRPGEFIDVLANDPQAADPLTLTSVGPALHGQASISSGKISFAPDDSFEGDDTFTYTATDAFGDQFTATVTFYNNAPQARDDTFGVDRGRAINLPVLQNDVDVDGDTVLIKSCTAPAHGSVVSTGLMLTYTPDGTFRGGDRFTYTISDGAGKTATATVQLQPADVATDLVSQRYGAVMLPGGNAQFGRYGIPTLNDRGDVAFVATINFNGRMRTGVFLSTVTTAGGAQPPRPIALSGDPAPGLPHGRFRRFSDPVLDAHGHVAFQARAVASDGTVVSGLWSNATDHSALLPVAVSGWFAPVFPSARYLSFTGMAISDDGRCIFTAHLDGPAEGDAALFVTRPAKTYFATLRKGQPVASPHGLRPVTRLSLFGALAGTVNQRRGFNGAGDLLVRVSAGGSDELLRTAPNGSLYAVASRQVSPEAGYRAGAVSRSGPAYYRVDNSIMAQEFDEIGGFSSKTRTVARVGDLAAGVPGSNLARFRTLGDPVANDAGDVAFFGSIGLAKPITDTTNDRGIWFARAGGKPALLVREGDKAPGLGGAVFTAFTSLALPGDRGVVFTAEASWPARPATRAAKPIRGLWAQDHSGALQLLLRTGDPAQFQASSSQAQPVPVVRDFTTLAATPTAPSQGRTANATGGVVARVTYPDLTRAILTFWVP